MKALYIVVVLLQLRISSQAADSSSNCPSLPAYDYGTFDRCNEGNSCPNGTVATLSCPKGFRVSGEATVRCQQIETKGGLIGKFNNDKPLPLWNPVIMPTCVVDPAHCPPLSKFENGLVDICTSGACPQGTDVKFSCDPGYIICGAVTISCQKLDKLESGWSTSQPTCVIEGQQCGSFGPGGILDFQKLFDGLFSNFKSLLKFN